MTKALTTLDPRAAKVREYHQIAMNAAHQATAAAIFAGLELRAIQADLKKSRTGETFEQWLSNHAELLGFTRATAFRYTALADQIKNKLLSGRDASLDRLLSLAPSQMNPHQAKLLLQTVNKSVDGAPLTELYIDYGIVKPPRPLPTITNPANNGAATRKPADTALIIQDELFGRLTQAGKMIEWWAKPVKIGNARVPVWQTMTEAQRADMERALEIQIKDSSHMLAQLKEARKRK